jgi:hypothetical protein
MAEMATTPSTASVPTRWSVDWGDDTYMVDDAGDVVTEAWNAGVDSVQSIS